MWIIIILVVIVLIVFFLFDSDRKKQIQRIDSEGGMRKKYAFLIDYLCGSQGSILRQSGSSIVLGATSIGGSTLFTLIQTFGSLTIKWEVNSPVFGKHSLEWEFPENEDQETIFTKIGIDIERYNRDRLGIR